jgi:hypothetical protein
MFITAGSLASNQNNSCDQQAELDWISELMQVCMAFFCWIVWLPFSA